MHACMHAARKLVDAPNSSRFHPQFLQKSRGKPNSQHGVHLRQHFRTDLVSERPAGRRRALLAQVDVYSPRREIREPVVRSPSDRDVHRLRFHARRQAQGNQLVEGVVPALRAVLRVVVPKQLRRLFQNLGEQKIPNCQPLAEGGQIPEDVITQRGDLRDLRPRAEHVKVGAHCDGPERPPHTHTPAKELSEQEKRKRNNQTRRA